MPWLFVLTALLVIGAVAAVAVGRWDALPDAPPDLRPDVPEPTFDVVLRGYRMDEVDQKVAALEAEVARLRGES